MSCVLRLPGDMHLSRSSSNVIPQACHLFLDILHNPHVLQFFHKVHHPLPLPRKTTSEKVVWTCCGFSRTDFHMCFVLQRRPLFQHLNFQKRSGTEVLVHFDFEMCFGQMACNFSSLIWPDGFAPAALASHKPLGKHSVSRLCYLFAHLHLLFADCVFFGLLSCLLLLWLYLLTFVSDSYHLCFSSVHIVESLTFELPSMNACMCVCVCDVCIGTHLGMKIACICKCGCIHACKYISIYIYINIWASVPVHATANAHVNVYVPVHVYVLHMHVHACYWM